MPIAVTGLAHDTGAKEREKKSSFKPVLNIHIYAQNWVMQ